MNRSAVRAQIDRILSSASFADKNQLRKLLDILSRNLDLQSTLKPDRVIRELWPEDNSAKDSADLATEMHRLRQALETYYSGEGQNDPVTIRLPDRSARAGGGGKQTKWIAAEPRNGTEEFANMSGPDSSHEPPYSSPCAATPQESLAAAPRAHPRKRLAFLTGGIAVAGLVIAVAFGIWGADETPVAGRFEGSTFTVINAQGEALWHKSFSGGFSEAYYAPGIASRMWIGDLEGNGRTEVLFLYQPAVDSQSHSTTLICYSSRGREKWRWTPGRSLPELGNEPPIYYSTGIGVLRAGPKGPPRIVVASDHFPFYPSQIALIDSHGRTMSEYWHSGHLDHLALSDPDDHGNQQIIAIGIDNGYHQATLVALDPDAMAGASDESARPEIQIHGMGLAREKLRLLFTRTDLSLATQIYNEGAQIAVSRNGVRVATEECSLNPYCLIWYEFDTTFTLRSVYADDSFRQAHDQYYRTTKDPHVFGTAEADELHKLRCVAGCKAEFVPFITN